MDYGVVIPPESLPTHEDRPSYRVLEPYTDQAIDSQIVGRVDPWARSWAALRTVPADWRQSVWAAAHQAAYTTAQAPLGTMQWLPRKGITMEEALGLMVEEFHRGHRPPRMETLITDI